MVAKIETAIRQNSGLIAEQILAGPPSVTPKARSLRLMRDKLQQTLQGVRPET